MPKPDWNRADVASIGLILAWFWPHNFGIRFEAWKKCHKNSVQVYSFMWIIRRLCADSKPQFCEQTRRIDLSVCCPCWFRIWQLNCQNNFLPSGSAGGKSMKIATKFNIVGSILVWYIHINTFLARAIIKLTVFHCRFATITVGELRSGVTGFATIFATGSHRFLLQVRNDEQGWDQSSTDKNGEFDLSLARVRYNFSLKYHRAL